MAGGTFTTQNKVRPGVYIQFESEGGPLGTMGERGLAAMALPLSWGEPHKILTIHAGDNHHSLLGYDITAEQMLLVRETLKRAKSLLLYRLNAGTQATAIHGDLTITAKFGGVRGNDLAIVVQPNADDEDMLDVKTYLDGQLVDSQTAADIAGLAANAWVLFAGTGALTATAGVSLAGGADGTATNQNHIDFLAALEVEEFHTLAYPGTDATLKGVYAAFIKRMREDEGRKVQGVMANYPEADYEGVISVKNGVVLGDGTVLTAAQATAWAAGATSAAAVDESLTYTAYDGAVDVNPRLTNSQIIEALEDGEFLFALSAGRPVVEQDINTYKSFTPDKGKAFRKNRTMRVMDGLANDWKTTFERYYIGKVDNNADGRNLFRKECVKLVETYQGMGAIQNFDPQTDITVMQGDEADAVYVEGRIQAVDAIEKAYMKVRVR
jgi:hypothetical protein